MSRANSERTTVFTPIHRALGEEPGGLTPELIEQAVEQRLVESADLDWKQQVYDHRHPHWRDEVAKDVAAMANSGGGWIVFGIEEDGPDNAAAKVMPVVWDAAKEQRLRQVAYAHVGPPVLGLEFYPVETTSGTVVTLRVPDSPDAPHLARKGDSAFVAPRRNGAHTAFMSEREIERAYRERFAVGAEAEAHLRSTYEQTAARLGQDDGVSFVLVALPRERRTDPLQGFDSTTAYSTMANTGTWALLNPANQTTGWHWRDVDVRRGYRQWVMRSRDGDEQAFWKAIHEDGSITVAYRLGGIFKHGRDPDHYPIGLPNHCLALHVEHALVDALALVRAWATQREINGAYRVRAGLVGDPSQPIYVRGRGGRGGLLPVENSEPIFHFHELTEDVDPLADDADFLYAARSLALDLVNQGGVRGLEALAQERGDDL